MKKNKDEELFLLGLSDHEREWTNEEELEFLKNRLKIEQDIYNTKHKKIQIGGNSYFGITVAFMVGGLVLGLSKPEMRNAFLAVDSGLIPTCLAANYILDKLGDKAIAKVESLKDSISDCEEKIKKAKEKELEKQIGAFDFEKKYDELSKDDYIKGMRKYYNNLVELSKTNPKKAKELADKAFEEQGLIEAGIIGDTKYEDSSKKIEGVSLKKGKK